MEETLQLSVGLIVKDEENCLERCLLSLQPLLKAIPSELVIADTGSTDHTPTIARKYTDKVYSITWCDDFSAARNFVLDQCCGSWFLQIDADESFEKVDSIIKFFKTGECDSYNDASFVVRNYFTVSKETYKDIYLGRMFKRGNGRYYQGIVHEFVPQIGPVKFFDECADHFGYARDPLFNEIGKKSDRNLPLLLKEVKKHPDNTRLLFQLVQEYEASERVEEAQEACKKILYRKNIRKDDIFITYAADALVRLNMNRKEYDEAIKNGCYYLNLDLGITPERLDILQKLTDIFLSRNDSERAKKYFSEYFLLIEFFRQKVKNGETGLKFRSNTLEDGVVEIKRIQWIQFLLKNKKYFPAMDGLLQLNGSLGNKVLYKVTNFWIEVIKNTGKYHALFEYSRSISEEETNKKQFLHELIMCIWDIDVELAQKISLPFIKEISDQFGSVLNILIMEKKGEIEYREKLPELCRTLSTEMYYQRVLFLSLREKIDILSFLVRCSINQVINLADILHARNHEMRDLALSADEKIFEENALKSLIFNARVQENLLRDVNLSSVQKREIFYKYVECSYRAAEKLYNHDFLNVGECENLPDRACFIVYVKKAMEYKRVGNIRECLHYMKLAVKYSADKMDVVKLEIDNLKEIASGQEKNKKEFDEYGKKIKEIIKNFILKKDIVSAKAALLAYEKVNPSDKEIAALREQVGIFIS